MREFKLKKWVAAGLMASMPFAGVVDAAGLGRLNVLSQLGQPFAAEIDLVNVTREELATLKANLAPPTAYQAANLSFNPSLNALRLSIERRPNGQPFIRASSFRPVAEPFLDLLIELTWQGGKVVREYSALLDPPGLETPQPAVTAPVAEVPRAPVATVTETPAQATPALQAPASAATPTAPARAAAKPAPAGGQYSVKSGDTLSGIAGNNKPEGVSLEQMLIGLFRANPDAFVNNNINQLRAGRILTIPEREQLAAIGQGEAAQEVRVHATNWHAYRAKVADVAPAAVDAVPSAKGKITARVDDKAAPAAPKDVVVLSKGDAGKGGKPEDRVRALQEDLAARDKALAESRERIAMLEKTLQEAKKLGEVKSAAMAPAAAKGTDKPAEKAPEKAADKSAKAEPPKPEAKALPAPEPKPEAKVEAPAPKPEAKLEAPAPKPAAPAPAPKPAAAPAKVAPPPAPEPDLLDTVMDNIVPIGGGAAALLAGGVGFWALRRRKKNDEGDDEVTAPVVKAEPFRGNAAAPDDAPVAVEPTVSNVSDVVDPIDEAQVYIDHGRDAQAEEILKEAMGRFPDREDIPLKLLEVYAARGDKDSFNTLARSFHTQTGGVGENWGRAVAMGYAVDPGNPLYPSSGEDVVDLTAGEDSSSSGLDLDIGGATTRGDDPLSTTADILLDQDTPEGGDMNRTMVLTREPVQTAAEPETPALPDFNIELPSLGGASEPAAAAPAAEAPAGNLMDFNIDIPAASAEPPTQKVDAPAADGGLDFKVDFGGLNLDLDDKVTAPATPAPAAGGAHDAHWEDVQQKFDLARAYQEMGDKEGAIEILREVEREGDAGQKSEAKKMLDSLK